LAVGEGQDLAPMLLVQRRSQILPLTDRVALGAKEGACETRSPLPVTTGRGKKCRLP